MIDRQEDRKMIYRTGSQSTLLVPYRLNVVALRPDPKIRAWLIESTTIWCITGLIHDDAKCYAV